MSADNYVGVLREETEDGYRYGLIPYGCMSLLDEDCQYRGDVTKWFDVRGEALEEAHNEVQAAWIVEYGVIELDPIPKNPCGRCYVCVHKRGVLSPDLTICDGCKKPISDSEWQTWTSSGKFHSRCEPRKKDYPASVPGMHNPTAT